MGVGKEGKKEGDPQERKRAKRKAYYQRRRGGRGVRKNIAGKGREGKGGWRGDETWAQGKGGRVCVEGKWIAGMDERH